MLRKISSSLELDHLTLPLLVSSELEMLASLDGQLTLYLALGALELEYQLLRGLGLRDNNLNGLN